MLEIKLLSLFVGSLGLQSLMISGWLRWQNIEEDRQCEEEEESLTPYEAKDLQTSTELRPANGVTPSSKDPRYAGWEFKIVRANRELFRDPVIFKRLCEEEAQAGWSLLEKLDDRRVRFKRPIALRDISKPELLPHDPYRTHYGPISKWSTVLGAIALLTATILPAYLGYVLVSTTLQKSRKPEATKSVPTAPPPTATTAPASPVAVPSGSSSSAASPVAPTPSSPVPPTSPAPAP